MEVKDLLQESELTQMREDLKKGTSGRTAKGLEKDSLTKPSEALVQLGHVRAHKKNPKSQACPTAKQGLLRACGKLLLLCNYSFCG